MNGILNVNKCKDWTSFDVVAKLRKILGIRHIGHLGTLDPMATGVLPITIGNATKLFDMFLNKTKKYLAEFEFGYLTDSLDATGQIIEKTSKTPTIEEIEAILPNFIGEIEQLPPQFSAKKVNGVKACDIARKGGKLELQPKTIFIKYINIISYENNILKLEIECGAGSYIRALARDIALKLNSLATMISLVRTEVGLFSLKEAIDITNLSKEEILSKLIATDFVFSNLDIIDNEEIVNKLLNGQILSSKLKAGDYRLYENNTFVAIASVKANRIKITKYFG